MKKDYLKLEQTIVIYKIRVNAQVCTNPFGQEAKKYLILSVVYNFLNNVCIYFCLVYC